MRTSTTSSRRATTPVGRWAFSLLWIGLLGAGQACGGANIRPYITPFPEAIVDTLLGEPEAVVQQLAESLRADSIGIRAMSREEGYLESDRFDARAIEGDTTAASISRFVRLRFWVDPIGGGDVQIAAEAVAERTVDPSLPPRQREVMVPLNHPGRRVLDQILVDLRARFRR